MYCKILQNTFSGREDARDVETAATSTYLYFLDYQLKYLKKNYMIISVTSSSFLACFCFGTCLHYLSFIYLPSVISDDLELNIPII